MKRSAQRPKDSKDSCSAGCSFLHLRISPQRDGRCRGDLHQERQCGDLAWRQRSAAFKSRFDRRPASCARQTGIPSNAIQLVDTPDRSVIDHLLSMNDRIDLAIPRGGIGLIERVTKAARMPVMKHFDGNCHVYVDRAADLEMATSILVNSKCQRMGVCNACESLLVHRDIAGQFLPRAYKELAKHQVEIRGDETVCKILPEAVPATEEDWSQEYLGPVLSAKVVDSTEQAIEWINHYGSHHTDAIVTKTKSHRRFSCSESTRQPSSPMLALDLMMVVNWG